MWVAHRLGFSSGKPIKGYKNNLTRFVSKSWIYPKHKTNNHFSVRWERQTHFFLKFSYLSNYETASQSYIYSCTRNLSELGDRWAFIRVSAQSVHGHGNLIVPPHPHPPTQPPSSLSPTPESVQWTHRCSIISGLGLCLHRARPR